MGLQQGLMTLDMHAAMQPLGSDGLGVDRYRCRFGDARSEVGVSPGFKLPISNCQLFINKHLLCPVLLNSSLNT